MPKSSNPKTFEEWMKLVNAEVERQIYLSCDDLPDIDYRSLYESGTTVKEAAFEAIQYAQES